MIRVQISPLTISRRQMKSVARKHLFVRDFWQQMRLLHLLWNVALSSFASVFHEEAFLCGFIQVSSMQAGSERSGPAGVRGWINHWSERSKNHLWIHIWSSYLRKLTSPSHHAALSLGDLLLLMSFWLSFISFGPFRLWLPSLLHLTLQRHVKRPSNFSLD